MQLYDQPAGVVTRRASFENPSAGCGSGGRENRGDKGHPCDSLDPGETKILLELSGSGTITRFWMTIQDRSPELLRGRFLGCHIGVLTDPWYGDAWWGEGR